MAITQHSKSKINTISPTNSHNTSITELSGSECSDEEEEFFLNDLNGSRLDANHRALRINHRNNSESSTSTSTEHNEDDETFDGSFLRDKCSFALATVGRSHIRQDGQRDCIACYDSDDGESDVDVLGRIFSSGCHGFFCKVCFEDYSCVPSCNPYEDYRDYIRRVRKNS